MDGALPSKAGGGAFTGGAHLTSGNVWSLVMFGLIREPILFVKAFFRDSYPFFKLFVRGSCP